MSSFTQVRRQMMRDGATPDEIDEAEDARVEDAVQDWQDRALEREYQQRGDGR